MTKITIDCAKLPTKLQLLQAFCEKLDEMYSPNWDALIDALSTAEDTEVEICNVKNHCEKTNLCEVLEIACEKNPSLAVKFVDGVEE